jgi:hypothetical protein
MDVGICSAILGGCAVIVAAIIKFLPKSNSCDMYISRREFEIWKEGFDRRWSDLEIWIREIQENVKELMKKVR